MTLFDGMCLILTTWPHVPVPSSPSCSKSFISAWYFCNEKRLQLTYYNNILDVCNTFIGKKKKKIIWPTIKYTLTGTHILETLQMAQFFLAKNLVFEYLIVLACKIRLLIWLYYEIILLFYYKRTYLIWFYTHFYFHTFNFI